jgi:hypothetical protein
MRLTQGNPLLVKYAVSLLHRLRDSPPPGRTGLELWEASLEAPFREDESTGFHWFVTERLAERVKRYKETHGKLWRLALPYRLVDDEKLENILFPSATAGSGDTLLRNRPMSGCWRRIPRIEIIFICTRSVRQRSNRLPRSTPTNAMR